MHEFRDHPLEFESAASALAKQFDRLLALLERLRPAVKITVA